MAVSVTIALEAYLKQRRELVETSFQCVLPDGTPVLPSEACMYSVLAGGKRLRPILEPGRGQDHLCRRPWDPGGPGPGLPRGCSLGDRAARTRAAESLHAIATYLIDRDR